MCQAGSGKYQAASAATLIAAQVKRECSRRQKVIDLARRPTPRAADAKTARPFDANRILLQRKNIFALMGAEPWIIRALQAKIGLWRSASAPGARRTGAPHCGSKEKAALRGGPISRLKSARLRSV